MDNSELASLFERVAKELHTKHDAGTTVMMAQRLHGIGGIFSGPGLDQVVISTHVAPVHSIMRSLPFLPSVNEDPRFAALTGFTSPDGSQPTNACEDAPTGFTKSCTLTAYFGLKRFDTQTIEMDQVMRRANRGDFGDLRLFGNLLGDNAPTGFTRDNVLNVITQMEMVRAASYMEMAIHNDIWTGTVAGGTFPGLDAQIATGQVDAATNVSCPSLDSDVKGFAYNDVCGTGLDIVEYLSMMMFYLESLAAETGVAPVEFVIAMRPQLWHELSACWPCKYNTNKCASAVSDANISVDIGGSAMIAERDRMRRENSIDINGKAYRVVLDTGIFEHNANNNANLAPGEYASSIYVVPMTIQGGFPVTYREYVDYRQAAPDEALLRGLQPWFHTDNGAYSWAWSFTRWCYEGALKTEQRVVLRTPHLAGKLQYVKYTPLQHLREPDFDSPYHSDGGVSLVTPSTRYAVWASGGVAGR